MVRELVKSEEMMVKSSEAVDERDRRSREVVVEGVRGRRKEG